MTAWLEELTERYLFTGRLLMESGLHIGGGRDTLTTTDSAVMKYVDDRPFIPGSSMKGAFRSAVERVSASLPKIRSCGLLVNNDTQCPTPQGLRADVTRADDQLFDKLCASCRLFGSPYMAGKVRFNDLQVIQATWAGLTEVRDGVGIDRDSECAVARIKYDYEVVPSETEFEFRLVVENPDEMKGELALVVIGLRELQAGMIPIGGIRTRGLGRCRLNDLTIHHLRFSEVEKFKTYLKEGRLDSDTFRLTSAQTNDLFDRQIDRLFE
jgi:CRISPR-associated protein Csm3